MTEVEEEGEKVLLSRAEYLKMAAAHHRMEHNSRVRMTEKQGRNNPCSCGSGKKYKKCCGK